MATCYSAAMPPRHPALLPAIWLVSDRRNDAVLENVLRQLPRGSGLIFRHHHLPARERCARFAQLRRIARRHGHTVVLAGPPRTARAWRADGAYGSPASLACGPALLRLATAHSTREIAAAHRARADAVLLSPVFPTRSHPGAVALRPVRFRLLAAYAQAPVIALGGMTAHRAWCLRWPRWAAIDGLS
jgi:thiamine-phosphate pyrophosphorylase